MISDLYSLHSLQNHNLLTPCSSDITVNGGIFLNKIELNNPNYISLCSDSFLERQNFCVTIDVSNIFDFVPTIKTLYGSTERLPLRFILSQKLIEIPKIQIDVSEVKNGNSYIQFEGSDFTYDNHILTNKIIVIHGQNNIHIMTPYEDGMFIGEPPHVSLIGDADYYLNEVKQISIFVPSGHANLRKGDNTITYKHSIYIVGFAFIAFITAFFYFKHTKRNTHERIPAVMIVKIHDKKDDNLSSFVADDESLL